MDALRLNNAELLSQIALLAYMKGGAQGEKFLTGLAAGRVGYEIYCRLSPPRVTHADVLRAQTIARISDYVKKHPNASDAQLKTEVEKEINKFAVEVAKVQ